MRRRAAARGIAVWVATCLGCASLAPAARPPVDPTGWRELRAPHFTLTSNAGEEVLRRLATDLERFILVVQEIANFPAIAPQQPTRIFAFRSNADVQRLAGSDFIGGMAVTGLDGNFLYFGVEGYRDSVRRALYHEFVHFLLFNASDRAYPLWYHEGLAEMLSTVRIRDDALAVGLAPADRKRAFLSEAWIPLEELLEARSALEMDPERASLFYAESWALVHFLHLRRTPELRRFLARLRRTSDWRDALARSFDSDVGALDAELHDYWLSLRSAVPVVYRRAPDLARVGDWDVEEMPAASAAYRLAELSLAMGRSEDARPLLEYSLRRQPGNARALAALGWCLALAGDEAGADGAIERADDEASGDAKVALFTGRAHLARAEGLEGPLRRDRLERARRALRRSTELSPDSPAGFASLGLSYVGEGPSEQEIARGIDALEVAHGMLPGQAEILFGLGWLQAQRGETERARVSLERAMALSHLGEVSEEMQELIDSLWPDEGS